MPASARNVFEFRPSRLRSCPTLRRARPTARSASSACRFWLTLSVMRRSSSSGAETRRASSTPASAGIGLGARVPGPATSLGTGAAPRPRPPPRCRASSSACAQGLGGIERRVFDAQQQSWPRSRSGMVPHSRTSRLPGIAREVDAAFAAGRHRADAVVDLVVLHRGGCREQSGEVAFPRARADVEGEGVVVDGQGGDGRPVVGLRVVDRPALGVGLPDVPGVVADNAALTRLTPRATTWSARSSMAASGLPVTGPMR